MQLIRELQPDFHFADERGTLTQLVSRPMEQVNVVVTKKGAVRGGGHYHAHAREYFYVISGEVEVTAWQGEAREQRVFGQGAMFCIDRLVRHSFRYLADTVLAVLYDHKVERGDGTKDILND